MAASLGYASGWARRASRRGLRVFYYHGVVERRTDAVLERNFHTVAELRDQVAFLKRQRVLSLDELLALLDSGKPLPEDAALVTFDDGYASSHLAAEILGKQHVPWVLFVTTACIETGAPPWTVELSVLLLHGEVPRVELDDGVWPLTTRAERERAFQCLRPELKGLPAGELQTRLATLRAQFPPGETQRLVEAFPSVRMLTWEGARDLCAAGVEVGSHGVDHVIHHGRQPPDVRRRELRESKRAIEERLKRRCRAFAFPNGDHIPSSAREAEDAGYEIAFTTQPMAVPARSDRHGLPRLVAAHALRSLAHSFYWEPRQIPSAHDGA